jgi:hypothetical protein
MKCLLCCQAMRLRWIRPRIMLFVLAKNNMNVENKKLSAKMSSNEYYHEKNFNWNMRRQKKCYARHPWWEEMRNGSIT